MQMHLTYFINLGDVYIYIYISCCMSIIVIDAKFAHTVSDYLYANKQ